MTDTDRSKASPTQTIVFRSARPEDGAAIWRLVKATGKLELNSAYFYLVFATDFGDTCLVAERGDTVVGAVVGYHPPRQPDTAFVWQVGVLPELRGQGLGSRLLDAWLDLPANRDCRWVTATVDEDNGPSRALFAGFARAQGVGCSVTPHFTPELFPHEHPAEPLLRIGPFQRDGSAVARGEPAACGAH
ncbi:diaminobutyrate acetyltransferase [Burkholderiaceae bacterium FT117]|uniref:diaminobutyrate acetyltransferase n=1 Tax=Zeimonas sediminis TaxID=2944268 RepID=UPI0023430442|nr:diaminobutyrate acetyltransferase [Zeimonas sediminis]MCM5569732.1 diaminobutyrate acetyltransferase [Zeimonas sediminis]